MSLMVWAYFIFAFSLFSTALLAASLSATTCFTFKIFINFYHFSFYSVLNFIFNSIIHLRFILVCLSYYYCINNILFFFSFLTPSQWQCNKLIKIIIIFIKYLPQQEFSLSLHQIRGPCSFAYCWWARHLHWWLSTFFLPLLLLKYK